MKESPKTNISEALRQKNPKSDQISLDFFLVPKSDQPKPSPFKIEKKPKREMDGLISQRSESSRQPKRSIDTVLNKINPKQKSIDKELASLEDLKKWQNSLDKQPEEKPKVPVKRPRPAEKEVTAGRETFSIEGFISNEIARKQKEKERLANISRKERELKEKTYRNSVKDKTEGQLSTEQVKQKERNYRFLKKADTSEFYDFLFGINPFAVEYSTPKVKIPHSFTDGAGYIETFKPCFFNEMGAYIESALAKADFFKTATVQADIKSTKEGYSWLILSEQPQEYSFQANFHADDLVLMYPLRDKANSYKDWKQSTRVGFFGVCEKEGPVKLLRVKDESCLNVSKNMNFQVTFIEKITTVFREFRMIREAEFLQLGDLIINPSTIRANQHMQVPSEFFNTILHYYNPSQLSAIQKICHKHSGITLLQGPPGTGKTHTLLGILSAFMFAAAQTNSQILVCAPSNAAINEIVNRVMKNGLYALNGPTSQFNCVRIGSLIPDFTEKQNERVDVSEEVRNVSLSTLLSNKLKEEGLTDTNAGIRDIKTQLAKVEHKISLCNDKSASIPLQDERRRLLSLLTKEYYNNDKNFDKKLFYKKLILESAHIIFCTLSTSGCSEMQELARNFDYVIIDEACQSVELSTLIPLQYSAKHVVMIGDPMQLPATTFATSSASTRYNRSLFERLAEAGAEVSCLEVQYRMTQEISDFSSIHFYNGRLQPAPEVYARASPCWLPSPALVFIDYDCTSEARVPNETSIFNKAEADFVGGLVDFIANRVDCFKSIGVITPYRKQVDVIKNALRRKGLRFGNGLEVDTVDGFQGREKELIVFSCVRTSGVGFLADFRRLNVAITRAKFGLFIVGCSNVLIKNNHWGNLIKYLRQRNSLVKARNLDQFLSCLTWDNSSVTNQVPEKRVIEEPKRTPRPIQPPPKYEKKKKDDKMTLDLVNDIINRKP